MLHFRMNMPLYLMALYGSAMIVLVLILRAFLKNRLPRFVFPILWGVVLLRLLVPFSLSSPLSLPVPSFLSGLAESSAYAELWEDTGMVEHTSDEYYDVRGTDAMSPAEDIAAGGEQASGWDAAAMYSVNVQETVVAEEGLAWGRNYSHVRWELVLPAVYLLGIAGVAFFLGRQKLGYAKRLRNRFLMEHNETVNGILRSMDMGHVLVFTNDEIASPLVTGLRNPRIYLPTRMDFANTALLKDILAHETMHIRRRDNWVKCVMLIALCLNWYNPLVWIMSKCLSSDLEAACDAAVLGGYDEEGRKAYAFNLLAMAVTGGRSTLLYSAFSKTEVEKRVKNIVHYKKATALALAFSVLFLAGSTVVFATGGQAPFSPDLSSYCKSDLSRWGVRASLTRDIVLGEDPGERANQAIFSALRSDNAEDPQIIEARVKAALAEEFGVEKGAFHVEVSLCLSREEQEEEYGLWEITPGRDGFWLYKGEQVRRFEDRLLGSYQSREEGTVEISVQRNSLGEIVDVTVWREGDSVYDEHTGKIEEERQIRRYGQHIYGMEAQTEG